MSEWISVCDRLPEQGIPVLICRLPGKNRCGIRSRHLLYPIMSARLRQRGGQNEWIQVPKSGHELIYTASHWMPLPERPRLQLEQQS